MVLAPGAVGLKFWRPEHDVFSDYLLPVEQIYAIGGSTGFVTGWGSAGFERLYQTFTPPAKSANITSIQFSIGKSNSPTDDVVVDIYVTDGSGLPTGSSLGTSIPLNGAALPGSTASRTFTFYSPVTILPNVKYAAVLSRSGALDGTNNYRVGHSNTSIDAAQQAGLYSGSSWSISSYDVWFVANGQKTTQPQFVVDAGSYALTGADAALVYQAKRLLAGAGAYTLTGVPATLTYVPFIPAATALLHFDGTNGSTSIVDSSGNNFTFAVAGAAALDTSTAVFGASSLHCTGGSVQGTGATGLNFGAGDYTVDFRFTNAAVPEFPSTLTNLVAWYKADTGVTTSSGNITQVLDQSGNGYHLVNNGTVPFSASSAYNSKPAFNFVAANGAALKTASNAVVFPSPANLCVFMVCRLSSASTGYAGGISIATGSGNDYDSTGNVVALNRFGGAAQIQSGDTAANLISNVSLDTNMRLGIVSPYLGGTGNLTQYINNVIGSGGTNPHFNTLTTPTNIIIGNRWLSGAIAGTGNCWEGPICEIVITSAPLTSTDRGDLDTYFTGKWGT